MDCKHEWWTFGIALADRAILVECRKCGEIGTHPSDDKCLTPSRVMNSYGMPLFYAGGTPDRVTVRRVREF